MSTIAKVTRLSNVRVLQEAGKLSGNGIVHPVKVGRETGYRKDLFYSTNRAHILHLLTNPKSLSKLPTKTQPRASGENRIVIKGLDRKPNTKEVYIDDIDSFRAVKRIKSSAIVGKAHIDERKFKLGIQKILGEKGQFTDWGGEKGDLLTSRLLYGGKRITGAFAFKGRGTRGVLTPAKMGKNGDQIQRLFESSAQVFILQYWGSIHERVREQVEGWATLTSLVAEENTILFG